jgi:fructokinase
MTFYGGIEAGGTKFNCIIATGPGEIAAETRFSTTTPQDTIEQSIAFFEQFMDSRGERLAAIGIASFGPVDLEPSSPTYGYITTTPKPGWKNTNFAGTLQQALCLPVNFETDVNAAAIAEYRWGAGQGLKNVVYFTIGTGIGAGIVSNGQPIHGLIHPEMGHILVRHNKEIDPFEGWCPYHQDCFEGLAAGPALLKRWHQPAETLSPDHPAWDLEADYIAQVLVTTIYTLSPQRIVLGGGVMQQALLFPKIRTLVKSYLNGYVQSPQILDQIDSYIVPPGLGTYSGMYGAIALAMNISK